MSSAFVNLDSEVDCAQTTSAQSILACETGDGADFADRALAVDPDMAWRWIAALRPPLASAGSSDIPDCLASAQAVRRLLFRSRGPMSKSRLTAPFLKRVSLLSETPDAFPFDRLAFLRGGRFSLDLTTPVSILVGENGSGKSTLLEAIAAAAGFPPLGGSRDHRPGDEDGRSALGRALRLSWLPKVSRGFFFRAESFFSVAGYLDEVGDPGRHGGQMLKKQSHGESFLAMFQHRFDAGDRAIYLLDEPEVALSPTRQLAFLRILRDWQQSGHVQAIIATHSPIIMALPGATLLSLDGSAIHPVRLEETEHYRVTRAFLADPDKALRAVFGEDG